MVQFVMDEIVAAAEIVAIEAMSITNFLYDEGKATAQFLREVVSRMESVFLQATAMEF